MSRALGIAAVALLLCLGAAPAGVGVGVGHRLEIRYPTVRAGQDEPFREVAVNQGPTSIKVTVSGVILFPCGGSRDIDQVAQVLAPNGGTARWNVLFLTLAGCTGTYTVTETLQDQHGLAQDTGTFTATP